MTDKELRKLRRADLLEMLLEQKKTVAAAQKQTGQERVRREETEKQLQEMDANCRWLREKLDEKEHEIHELRAALEAQSGPVADETAVRTLTTRINKAVEAFENAAEKLLKK